MELYLQKIGRSVPLGSLVHKLDSTPSTTGSKVTGNAENLQGVLSEIKRKLPSNAFQGNTHQLVIVESFCFCPLLWKTIPTFQAEDEGLWSLALNVTN